MHTPDWGGLGSDVARCGSDYIGGLYRFIPLHMG